MRIQLLWQNVKNPKDTIFVYEFKKYESVQKAFNKKFKGKCPQGYMALICDDFSKWFHKEVPEPSEKELSHCYMCGRDVMSEPGIDILCQYCEQWWKDNPPPQLLPSQQIKHERTKRGFIKISFNDTNGIPCSLQESSIQYLDEDQHLIWLGCDQVALGCDPQNNDNVYARMHLSRDQVKNLLPFLMEFVRTGGLPPPCGEKENQFPSSPEDSKEN